MSRRILTEAQARKKLYDLVFPVLQNVPGKVVIVNIAPYDGDYFYQMWNGSRIELTKHKPLLISWDEKRYKELMEKGFAVTDPTK